MIDPAVTKAIEKMGSAARLAAALGITRAAVSQWRWIPGKHVRKVAEVTGIPLSELMSDQPRPTIVDDDSGECGEQGASR